MGKISTSGWGKFKVGDFFKAERGKVKSLQIQGEGKTPVIAAGGYNQGIAGKYDVEAECKNQITISCNGAGCGSVFYHPYPFNINGDAIVLTELKPMNDAVKQFISCILNGVLTRKYSYEEKCSADKAMNEIIMLPVDDNNNPDWDYMERYIKNIEMTVNESLLKLQSVITPPHKKKINVSGWKKYQIKDLFDVSRPAVRSQSSYSDGSMPFVASGNYNNGVIRHCIPKDEKDFDLGNCITISPLDGSAFYQKEDFLGRGGAGSAILILRNDNLTKYSGLYIASIIRNALSKYSYSDQLSSKAIITEQIILPTVDGCNPDWTYMENYIRAIEKSVIKDVVNWKDTISKETQKAVANTI